MSPLRAVLFCFVSYNYVVFLDVFSVGFSKPAILGTCPSRARGWVGLSDVELKSLIF